MWPRIEANAPLFLLALLVFGSIAWRRTHVGLLLFTLSLSAWVAQIFLEEIRLSTAGAPAAFLTFIFVALIVNGVLLFRTMTS